MDKEDNFYPLFDDGLYTEVIHQNGEKAVKILKGDYRGVVYQYGKIEFIPREESDIPTINFDRAVRICPENLLNTIQERYIQSKQIGNQHFI